MTKRRLGSLQRGFSLLELLVAFSIMALSVGMIYRATGSNVRNLVDVEQYQQAIILGESLISSVDGVPSSGLSDSGAFQGFAWTLKTVPSVSSAEEDAAPKLHQVDVQVSWSERGLQRQIMLTTLRPQRAPLTTKAP